MRLCDLPYRRIAFCGGSATARAVESSDALPITNRRYGRLEICATIRGSALALLFTTLLVCGLFEPVSLAEEKPNILFLLSDDHSYPFVGCYGKTNVRTPTLDRLAADGMKFHRFFTSAPQCVPSRAALMTAARRWPRA